MRVAVIAPPWLAVPPSGYGGTELVLDVLCRGLQEQGHEVLLCTTGDSTCPVERHWVFERSLGTTAISPAAELHHVIEAYDAAAAWRADIVHDHTITGLAWGEAFPTLPVVTTNHGPFEGDLAAVLRRVGGRVPIIAISHHQASTAGTIPIGAVIHHGIDLSRCDVGDGRGGYALFLGRMSPDKGVTTAITVARRAGVPLKIAAKMQERAELDYFAERVRPMLGGDIEYVGEVGPVTKAQLLRDALCLLNPIAWAEPFGMVMIEALAHGTPVVATPFGSAPEIIDDGRTGFLRNDEDSLLRALERVPELDRTACRRAAEERFSMSRMAAEHITFYDAQLERRGPSLLSARVTADR